MRRAATVHRERGLCITRDAHGVLHAHGATDADLFRGLGRCHALDRPLQLLLQRMLGCGRASEVLGPGDDVLRLDVFFRRLDPGRGASQEVTKLGAGARLLIEAYTAGVNAVLSRRVPWELRMLGYRFEPWRPEDSMLLSRLTGYVALAQSQGEMERLLLEMNGAGVSGAHLAELFPGLPPTADLDLLRRVELGDRVVPELVRWSTIVPRAVASNNWVLSGRKTSSGHPLLANDPHLEVNRLPAVWYEVVLELPDRFCIAATLPGVPVAALGRTNDLAWGATYTFMDAVDSWVEECRDGAYRRVSADGDTWVPFRRRAEVIRRKGAPDATVTFYENDHGVLDGDPAAPGLYLATRWASGSGTGAASMAAFIEMLRARSVTDGMRLLGQIETAWNFVLADAEGNIGYQMSGLMPVRREGHDGLLPLPGWDPANDWRGFVAPHDLPRALNPAAGFIVTANDDLNHLGHARPINLPMGDYRARRIAAALAARDDWDVLATQRLQMDVLSLQAEQFMAILRPLLPATPHADVLRRWDLSYGPDSEGAYLFETFYRALLLDVFGAVCGAEVIRFVIDETPILADFYANFDRVLLRADSVWYGTEGRDAAFRRVAERSLTGPLRTWGQQRRLVLKHLLFGGRVPSWLGFDYGPIALRGGRATIHQGQIYRSGRRETTFAPSYRLVTDLGERAAWTALAGGASDRRFSRWYTSSLRDWLAGRLKRLSPDTGSANHVEPDHDGPGAVLEPSDPGIGPALGALRSG
jgi:penicillin amidase